MTCNFKNSKRNEGNEGTPTKFKVKPSKKEETYRPNLLIIKDNINTDPIKQFHTN